MELDGKVAVVTGGAGGIGRAIARRLLLAGCSVELWDLHQDRLDEVRTDLEIDVAQARTSGAGRLPLCTTAVVDITRTAAVVQAASAAIDRYGDVDILVNNAGHMAPGSFLDQTPETWKLTVDVNLTALITVTHAFLPHFYQRGAAHVVNISSAAALVGVSGLAVYSATKWAVWGLTEALRHEAVNRGLKRVRFSSVHPNYIRSGMFGGAAIGGVGGLIFPRLKNHDAVAQAVVQAALRRGRRTPRRPRSLRIAMILRGLLPDAWFAASARALNVHTSMESWKGER
jgi:NAD(P)-dependent dehydrogenase (short-subunit alcohol dehydrogenase family)